MPAPTRTRVREECESVGDEFPRAEFAATHTWAKGTCRQDDLGRMACQSGEGSDIICPDRDANPDTSAKDGCQKEFVEG